MQAMNPAMTGKIVACEHWKGGDTPTICAKCQAKFAAAGNSAMIPGKIVGCEHSKNGVCTACQAALNMPGQFVMAGQPQPATAPGRAVASSYGQRRPGRRHGRAGPGRRGPGQLLARRPGGHPDGSPMRAPAGYAPQASAPGRAVAESNAGHDPYQPKSGPFPHPHILGHLFGWSGLGAEKAEAKARKKAEAHAMITYDENGTAPVDEVPASMVFGKKRSLSRPPRPDHAPFETPPLPHQ